MSSTTLKLHNPETYMTCEELSVIRRLLPLNGARVLELGCGKAEMTRTIAETFAVAEIVATEVDVTQHRKNLAAAATPPGIRFHLGGAEAIAEPDDSVDVVMMFKSLHHVPMEFLNQALAEIHRVLKPEGLAYISEPVFAGEFNDILRLFHDEKTVREAAFAALERAVASGLFELAEEVFFQVATTYPDFEAFEERIINITYADYVLDEALYHRVRERFMAHMTGKGATFRKPMRVDLLRKPVSAPA